ncbi:Pentatricopeptide repeat-containing protein [Apostasia shenzhenica]|uniref:Pentatricopeptide repeat-containing protein n=1 Tax=Apostasia shenzhenica TaxID=1088818 RepID=A0A2I0BFH5_9ASPA|nr:Pentatricopeptide repeat-containing protein [Apostasia shenzhenica]
MPHRTTVSYNSIISALCRSERAEEAWEMLIRMRADGLSATHFTFPPILSCPSSYLQLSRGIQLHPLILKSGLLHPNPFSATALLNLLGRNGRLADAAKLFDEMPEPTVLTWNCIILAFAQPGFVAYSMFYFRELMRTEIEPTVCSFLGILSAFRSLEDSFHAEQVHGLIVKSSLGSSMQVSNALLNAYLNCFSSFHGEKFFDLLPARDLISWNTFTTFIARGKRLENRVPDLIFSILSEGFVPNDTTFTMALAACSSSGSLRSYGLLIHGRAIKLNMTSGVFVGSSLIDFYAKSSRVDDAFNAFWEIPNKNIVTWNALLSGITNDSSGPSCVAFFKQMVDSGTSPNECSFSSVLKSASVSDLKQLHSLIIRMGYDTSDYVSSSLIASYASQGLDSEALACTATPIHIASSNAIAGILNRRGQFEEAKKVVLQQEDPDDISWNIMLTSLTRKGEFLNSLQHFRRMQHSGFLLDNYTAVIMLTVSSRLNALHLGRSLHGLIFKSNAGCSEVFVQNVLMDMYAKCGSLDTCTQVFDEMPERNLVSWTALVSGLGLHGRGLEALARFSEMEREGHVPDKVAFFAVLSACRHGGLVEEGTWVLEKMTTGYGIEPEMDHYACVVDLLCGSGRLKEAEIVIGGMPFKPSAAIWRTFLQGCKKYSFS